MPRGHALLSAERVLPHTWNHVAVTRTDAGLGKIFINGVKVHEQDEGVSADSVSDGTLHLGFQPGPDNGYGGGMCSVKLLDKVLTESEIETEALRTLNWHPNNL